MSDTPTFYGVDPEQLVLILKMQLAPLYKKLEIIQAKIEALEKSTKARGDK